jgi:glutamate carboxypeptidase
MGPGVFDMKAGILLAWWAMSDLLEKGKLSRSVTVLLNSDEESGSHSSQNLIEAEARKARAVLVLEPSLPGGVLKTARKGVGRFTLKAIGRAAHAGVDPDKGVNAIEEIANQVIRLHRMTDAARGTTVNVTVMQGGTRTNVIPADATVDIDVRVASLDEADRLTREIRGLSPHLPGATLEVRGGITRPPMERSSDTARLFEIAKIVARDLGIDLKEGSTGGGSDGNFTAAIGVPTLDGLGAVGDFAHGIDEFVVIDSLAARAALIAGLIERV